MVKLVDVVVSILVNGFEVEVVGVRDVFSVSSVEKWVGMVDIDFVEEQSETGFKNFLLI